jgi:hypothetical protein
VETKPEREKLEKPAVESKPEREKLEKPAVAKPEHGAKKPECGHPGEPACK